MKKILITVLLILYSFSSFSQNENEGNFQFLTGYYNDIFTQPSLRSYHFAHTGFGYNHGLTAIYGKINVGYKYNTINEITEKDQNNIQIELDYWQSLNKNKSTSFWLNYAYGLDDFFPEHRLIFEAWQKLYAGFLISGGITYFRFSESYATFLNTGIEKYFGRWWIEGKTYFYLKEPNITMTYALSGRMFIKDVNFLEIGISVGSAQDEPFIIEEDLNKLFAYTGKVRYVSNIFAERMRISSSFTYIHEEYNIDTWRNRYSLGVGLIININK